jgi:Uma2 family endonuclease
MPRTSTIARFENMGEVLDRLGGISPSRVRMRPLPGTATEKDLLKLCDHTGVICELVDGILVEKVMDYAEGSLGTWISYLLQCYLDEHDLGNLAGADGFLRLMNKLVRAPDVSFVLWEKLPGRFKPKKPIPDLIPDLAIEVLSEGNTPGEMALKRREYFFAGTELVWMVDPDRCTVTVYTAPDRYTVFTEADTLDGGDVLPGLSLPVRRVFQRLRAAPGSAGKKKRRGSSRKRKKDDE